MNSHNSLSLESFSQGNPPSHCALENQSRRIRVESTSKRQQPNDFLLLLSGLWAEKPQIRISKDSKGQHFTPHAPSFLCILQLGVLSEAKETGWS